MSAPPEAPERPARGGATAAKRKRVRADLLLVERGLACSRERARALILGGRVLSGTARVDKAGALLSPDAELSLRGGDIPYVSRGGLKLAGALDDLGIDPRGATVADIGASTGGFTDCVLQRGARRVYAIDVGYGQLHETLRRDARVVVMERTNARHLTADSLPEAVDLVLIDASFIGLDKLLPAATRLLGAGGAVLAMVKPQFELGRADIGKRGVVRDEGARRRAIEGVIEVGRALGLGLRGEADAPIKGPQGNQETFLWLG